MESWGDGRGEGEHVDGGGRRGKGGKVAAQAEGLEVQQMCLEISGYLMDSLTFGALKIFGNIWKYLEIVGNLWKTLEIQWISKTNSLEIFGNAWKSLEFVGDLWKSLEIRGNPMCSLIFGIWNSLEMFGNPMVSLIWGQFCSASSVVDHNQD